LRPVVGEAGIQLRQNVPTAPILTGSFFLNRAFFPKDFVVPDSIRQDLYLLTFGVNYHFNPLPVVTAPN
jgi:hypothetical protein